MRWLLALLIVATPVRAEVDLVVEAELLHTAAGEPLERAVVLIEQGKIVWVGARAEARIPSGAVVLEAAVVTPGFVDAHSVVGLAGQLNSPADQQQLETSSALQPQLRAIDAYAPNEPLIDYVRSMGVTTLHTGHAPGAVISGQTLIAKTRGATVAEAVLRPGAALAATLGGSVFGNFDSPKTHAKSAALLREALVAARDYREKLDREKPPAPDLGKQVLVEVLDGQRPLMITAHGAAEIATALRLQEEFGFRLWLDGAAEAYRMIDPILEAGVPVLLHAPMKRAAGDAKQATMASAARLHEAGVPFAIQTGYESYVPKTRVLLYEAQVAVHAGLDPRAALGAITQVPARFLGLADRVGTIEPGKDADLVLFDGDPFEYTTHICAVVIEGIVDADPAGCTR